MDVEIDMPKMTLVGLSENWLLRHCGNDHWQGICEGLGVASSELTDSSGRRLYASFLAARIRATPCLAAFRENDRLNGMHHSHRFGASIYESTSILEGANGRVEVELVTKFVARQRQGRNVLQTSSLRPMLQSTTSEAESEPGLIGELRRVRAGGTGYQIGGLAVSTCAADYGTVFHVPNPYLEYNGAGLLYFASYPTICDALEREFFSNNPPFELERDWALSTSTRARDTFYFGNLDLGRHVEGRVRLLRHDTNEGTVLTHTSLMEASTERLLAEIFTIREIM